MTTILYYKRGCSKCGDVLQAISQMGDLCKSIHFQCVDRRVIEGGKTYIILDNNTRVIMPAEIIAVPAIVDLVKNGAIIYGDSIYAHLNVLMQQHKASQHQSHATETDDTFAFGGWSGGASIVSDSFSFLDSDPDDMRGSGRAGERQQFHYSMWNEGDPSSLPFFPTADQQYQRQYQQQYQQQNPVQQPPAPQKIEKDLGRVTQSEIEQYMAQRELGVPKPIARL